MTFDDAEGVGRVHALQDEEDPGKWPDAGTPRRSLRLFLVMTLGLFGLFSAWSIAGPIGSAPDEYQHYKYAYAIWSGQVGDDDPNYDLPRSLIFPRILCYAFQPEVTADCDRTSSEPDLSRLETVQTTADNYPPLYYALAGWVLRIDSGDSGVIAARLVGALPSAALLAWAASVLYRRRHNLALTALTLSITPMVAHLSGSFHPDGLQFALAALLGATALSLLVDSAAGRAPDNVAFGGLCASLVLLPLARPGGLFLALLTCGLVALAAFPLTPTRFRTFLGSFRWTHFLWLGIAVASSLALVLLWGIYSGSSIKVGAPPTRALWETTFGIARRWDLFPTEWVGKFFSLDAPVSQALVVLWFAAGGTLVFRGLAGPARRLQLAQFATLASAFALTVYVAYTAPWEGGLVAQGRYVLTFVSLILVLGGFAAERTAFSNDRGMALWIMCSWVLIQACGLALGLKRVMVGASSSWFEPPSWSPPVSATLLVAVATLGSTIIAWAVTTAVPRDGVQAAAPRP